jgi:hypothetical protein
MAVVTKTFNYEGGVKIASVPHGTTLLTMYLWGGAGGGGGNDVGVGGSGASGQYVTKTNLDMTSYAGVKNITVSVGGGGGAGTLGSGAEGGENGKSITSWSGGTGGTSGTNGASGSGGGGGGATVVTIFADGEAFTNTIIAAAGGGAGGGGGGSKSTGGIGSNTNSATGRSPGTLGENGANHGADGGAGGAGGGGTDGGTGGSGDAGDVGGFGGRAGSNTVPSGGSQDNGSGITPGGTGIAQYGESAAVGGGPAVSGANGRAVLIFTIPAEAHFKESSEWKAITGIHTKVSDTWKQCLAGYTRVSGTWKALFANEIFFHINFAGFGDSDGGLTSGTAGVEGQPASIASVEAAQSGGGGGSCFIAGTMVRMADGTDIKIEDIVVGDIVKGKDEDNTVIQLVPTVLSDRKLYAFNGSNNFFVTADHPFWTAEGWKSIDPEATLEREGIQVYKDLTKDKDGNPMVLKAGDDVQTLDGIVRIRSIESKEINNLDLPLYTFMVTNDHSYFADSYCVHNVSVGGCREVTPGPVKASYANPHAGFTVSPAGWSPASGSCFVAGTMVRMADGTDIKIEDVIIGDMIKGKTSDNEVMALKPSTLGNQRLYAFNGCNNFFVTDEHPFWTKEGWKSINPKATKLYNELESGALSIGDYIQTLDGMIRIKSIESKNINNKDLSLYNFEVTGDHSYFADRYCVHNKGGNAKIICTKLFELGYLSQEIFTADQKFGQWLRENDPYAYFGYVKWASVVVEWMDKEGPQCMFWIKDKKARGEKQKALAISWAKRIATPWAQHMAYRMGIVPEDNRAGRTIMKFGLWLSRLIGKTTNTTTNTKSVKLGYSMWAIFGILYIMAGLKGK